MRVDGIKRCSACMIEKPLEQFYRRYKSYGDGYQGTCILCWRARAKRWSESNRERMASLTKKWLKENKDKRAIISKRYAEKNKEKIRAIGRRWKQEHRDIVRQRRSAQRVRYRDERNQKTLEWKRKNPGAVAAHRLKRALSKKKAYPKWANDFFIEEIYGLAQLRTKLTGIKWHVDHIYPLSGKNVCGLHCEQNLRVVPAAINQRKYNLHPVDFGVSA